MKKFVCVMLICAMMMAIGACGETWFGHELTNETVMYTDSIGYVKIDIDQRGSMINWVVGDVCVSFVYAGGHLVPLDVLTSDADELAFMCLLTEGIATVNYYGMAG